MSLRVFGVGIGVSLLAVTWIISLLACVYLTKLKGSLHGAAVVFIVGLLSVVLLVMPRESLTSVHLVHQKPDPIFLGRLALLVLVGIAAMIVGPAILIKTHCAQKIHARPLHSPTSKAIFRGYVQLGSPTHRGSEVSEG
ncbi:transmembrane protein 218-like [Ornithodoros turicata]|uniref:transmembrane protein 218-like n=1 Tax=Ornithodoros turicata TaxID=34597 RepID=UPI00313A1D15